MRNMRKVLMGLLALVIAGIFGAVLYLYLVPPTLLRVGAGYSSKIVCSAVYLQGRAPDEVLETDVQAPGNPILRAFKVTSDSVTGRVRSAFLGVIAPMTAVHRAGLGCAAVPDGNLAQADDQSAPAAPGPRAAQALWPEGAAVDLNRLLAQWDKDGRAAITVAQLLSMSSGLHFNEDYGDVSDVTRMLYLQPDMAALRRRKNSITRRARCFTTPPVRR